MERIIKLSRHRTGITCLTSLSFAKLESSLSPVSAELMLGLAVSLGIRADEQGYCHLVIQYLASSGDPTITD